VSCVLSSCIYTSSVNRKRQAGGGTTKDVASRVTKEKFILAKLVRFLSWSMRVFLCVFIREIERVRGRRRGAARCSANSSYPRSTTAAERKRACEHTEHQSHLRLLVNNHHVFCCLRCRINHTGAVRNSRRIFIQASSGQRWQERWSNNA
jgi:hypothetical protein